MSHETPSRAKRRSAEQWREIIGAFRTNEQSAEAFCEAHGLNLTTFSQWRWRFSRASRAEATKPTSAGQWLELNGPTSEPSGAGAYDLELDLGGGVTLRLRRA